MNFTQQVKNGLPTGIDPSVSSVENITQSYATVEPSSDSISNHNVDVTIDEGNAQARNISQDSPVYDLLKTSQDEKYILNREIARGGMGVVMEAEDNTLHRDVAMKVMINPHEASMQQMFRFIEEACITSQLQHPGIMPIYELGVDKNGNAFYTMKRVTGRTLKEILKALQNGEKETESEYPLNRLLNILQRVCDAVAYAHSKGVIHRDLKPDNIMIGDYGEVLVLDWGLAKVLKRKTGVSLDNNKYKTEIKTSTELKAIIKSTGEEEGSDDILMTMEGNAIGTLGYMAPEQARGQIARMNEKSDIYSLGAILYHILALEPTVKIDSKTTKQELLNKIRAGQITPLKETKRAPKSLGLVAMKALSSHPKDRYSTVKRFQADLDAYLGGFATSAEDLSAWKLIALFIRRHKVVSIFVAIILTLQALAFSVIIAEKQKAVEAEEAAVAAGKNTAIALSNLKATAPALATLSDSHLQRGEMEDALKIISNATELVPENAEYHRKRGNILQTMYRFKEASEEYAKILTLAPGDKNAEENLDICRTIEAEPQKLFLALRKQNRLTEAMHVIMPLTKKPETLSLFLKKILDSEKSVYNSFKVDDQGKCSIELNGISDLSPWRAFPITSLTIEGSPQLSNLSPLKGMPLTALTIRSTAISDLSPLNGMQLTSLLFFKCEKLSDLTPLATMPLNSLFLDFTGVSDLTPLKGIPLTELRLSCCSIADLSPLKNMPLTKLEIIHCAMVSDLTPLTGMQLTMFSLCGSGTSDLSPLNGMPLTELGLSSCKEISDLSFLKDMPLNRLVIQDCAKVKDLSFLRDKNITDLVFDDALLEREKTLVYGMKYVKVINGSPASQFQKKFEENNRKQPEATEQKLNGQKTE